jgi:hypothetical protein
MTSWPQPGRAFSQALVESDEIVQIDRERLGWKCLPDLDALVADPDPGFDLAND